MTLLQTIRANATGLALYAVVTVGVIAVTEAATRDRIAAETAAFEARTLRELVPGNAYDHEPGAWPVVIAADPLLNVKSTPDRPATGWQFRRDGVVTSVVLPVVAPDGYSGEIRLLVGIAADGHLTGVRTVAHRETPGLGDAVELRKSPWVLGFDGRALTDPDADGWRVRKDGGIFDAFTGATITPRAVVGAVHRSLQYFDRNRATLLRARSAASEGSPT